MFAFFFTSITPALAIDLKKIMKRMIQKKKKNDFCFVEKSYTEYPFLG